MSLRFLLAVSIFAAAILSPATANESEHFQIYSTQASFTDVRQDVIDAIINRGYVMDFNGRIGDMLKRTREDVGGKPLYRDAEFIIFCSAVLSRRAMESDMHAIGHCPYSLSIYESVDKPGTVFVSYRKFTRGDNPDKTLVAIEKLLDDVAREALE